MSSFSKTDSWQFWIDRGGTFTDIVALQPNGVLVTRKLLSENPERYQDAAVQGIQELLAESPNLNRSIACVKMGTTVGTNALLERRGEPVGLVINKGLRDFLRIGYQNRPDIFALDIQRAEPLYQAVEEIDVRMDVNGNILRHINEDDARYRLQNIYSQGIRALAIVLLHAWRFPEQEQQLADLAKTIGFTQISVSHEVSALPKLVSRGDTTVVDAYLSPILRRYVAMVEAGLAKGSKKPSRLLFMQSNGGLVEANIFRGRDSILSGPAGGLVGAAEVSTRAGFNKIIAFDMGGTSTDVAHYAGEFERSFDTEIAGVRIRAPMMHIHTVAAGGGSILHFDGLRMRVGPESAGANPGPACYRRGGPLTITDANLLLGKLPRFPNVFGPEGNLPPDLDRVKSLFASLTQQINSATGQMQTSEQVAEGFLEIAIEHMVQAIKKISVQRGYALHDYALCCYGAAGAQHACKIAEKLGIVTILLHPLAGVLSAYGMGLADFRILKERAFERLWQDVDTTILQQSITELIDQGTEELRNQGIAVTNIRSEIRIGLRFEGTDSALMVLYDTRVSMELNFRKLYQQRFGFCHDEKALVLSSVQVECIGKNTWLNQADLVSMPNQNGQAETLINIYTAHQWQQTPVFHRDVLAVGQKITGPAIVLEPTSTIVIEPNWQACLTSNGELLLELVRPVQHTDIGTELTPVWLELFNKRFMSIAEQMGFVLQNTAHSVNIKERLDFSCALFDAQGQLVANAPHIPVHLGSMGETVQALLESHGKNFKPGEAYLVNSPYAGGTHLPDITVVTPVFNEKGTKCIFFVASRGHHADIGGISPGSMPARSLSIDDEGVISAGLKILDQGKFEEIALRAWLKGNALPARNPEQNLADLQAQLAANAKGAQELAKLVQQYTLPVVLAYMQHVQDHAEACVRRVIDDLRNGEFCYAMDNGATIKVKVQIDQVQRKARIDFTGTSEQLSGNFNAPMAVVKAAVLYVFRTLVQDDIPLNAGCLKPLEIIIPEGSMLNPRYPAAVVAGNVETSQAIVDALYGALGILAGSQGTMNNFTFGNARYQYYETLCGGAGAGKGFHGADAIHTHMTNSRITDPEILESRFPVMLEEFSVRIGSGGSGRWRGGNGIIRRIRFNENMQVGILTNHRKVPPFGLAGGGTGNLGVNRVIRNDGTVELLASCVDLELQPGDCFEIATPGGGGYGKLD